MTAMFETVEDLNRKLRRPAMTGEPAKDALARKVYIDNAHAMRSEAFACVARSMVKGLKKTWRQLTTSGHAPHTNRA
jgi:hypothetical protein